MQIVYQYDAATGYATGASAEIGPQEGVLPGWTRAVPPEVAEGAYAVWGGGRWVETTQPPGDNLAALKAAKNEQINQWRLEANASSFEYQGKRFAVDRLSKDDIVGANGEINNLGALPAGWPGGWKAIDNTYIAITTVEQWRAFYSAMFAQGNANFARAQTLKALVANAATADEVQAIEWGSV